MKSKIEDEIENTQEVQEVKANPKVMDSEDVDIDYDDDSVESGGPDVASGKGSKVTLIAFSAILVAVVLYFLFFNSNQAPPSNEELDLAAAADNSNFSSESPAGSADLSEFNSVFDEITSNKNTKEDVILETPDIPSVPQLPDIFGDEVVDDVLPAFLDLPKDKKQKFDKKGKPIPSDDLPDLPSLPGLPGEAEDLGGLFPGQGQGGQGGYGGAVGGGNDPQTNAATPSSIIVVAGAPGPTNSVGYENNIINLNKDPIADLKKTEAQVTSQFISDRSTTLIQGKILTAVLETAINTEFPGEVRGIISRDVYAESGNNVLIPRGSRIYGSYSSSVARGQARVTINWSRLIRPDGVDASISLAAADQFGRAGIEGDVDNKYGSLISSSILTSVLAIGGSIAAEKLSGNGNTTTTTDPTTGTSTSSGSASGQAIYDVTKTIIDTVGEVVGNTLDLSPVIRVPQGTKITIVVNSDMSLPQFKK